MWKNTAVNILRYRQYFLVGILIWTIFMLYFVSTHPIEFARSNAQLIPDDDSIAINLKHFSKTFGSEENILFMGVLAEDLQSEKKFENWKILLQKLESKKGIKQILSVGDALQLQKDTVNQRFDYVPIREEINSLEEFNLAIATLEQLPFYKNLVYNPKTTALQTLLYLDSEIVNTKDRESLVIDIQQAIEEFSERESIKVHTSGMPLIRTMNAKEIKQESYFFILVSLIISCLLFTLIFKSFKATITVAVIVLLAVLSSFFTMAFLQYEITVLTALVPPLMIVIGVPNCIFLLNKYYQEYNNHQNKAKALVRTIMKIGNAMLLTNFTTAFGFFTFIFTNSATLKQFGIVASVNIMLVFVYSLLILPIAFSYFKAPRNAAEKLTDSRFSRNFSSILVMLVRNYRKQIFTASIILFILSIVGLSMIHRSSNMLDDMSKKAAFYKDIAFFDHNFGGVLPLEIVVEGPKGSALRLSKMKKINRLYRTLDSIPSIGRPLSMLDGVEYARQAYYNGNAEYYALPSNYENTFIQQYIKNSKGDQNMLNNFVDSTRSTLRVSAVMKNENSDQLEGSVEKIQSILNEWNQSEQDKAYITGVTYVFMEGTKYLTKNLLVSLLLAILMISIMMALMFRSVRMIAISIIPNLLPLLMTAACMGFFNIPLKPSTILVFSIAFGIAVDDTIHFLAKFRQEMHFKTSIETSVIRALEGTANSMFYSSVVLFFGFSSFLFSGFEGIQALGGLISLTLLFAVFSNLILLPALLIQFESSTFKNFVFPDIDYFDEDEKEPIGDLVDLED